MLKRVDWIMELLGKILMTTKGSLYVKGKVVAGEEENFESRTKDESHSSGVTQRRLGLRWCP